MDRFRFIYLCILLKHRYAPINSFIHATGKGERGMQGARGERESKHTIDAKRGETATS